MVVGSGALLGSFFIFGRAQNLRDFGMISASVILGGLLRTSNMQCRISTYSQEVLNHSPMPTNCRAHQGTLVTIVVFVRINPRTSTNQFTCDFKMTAHGR